MHSPLKSLAAVLYAHSFFFLTDRYFPQKAEWFKPDFFARHNVLLSLPSPRHATPLAARLDALTWSPLVLRCMVAAVLSHTSLSCANWPFLPPLLPLAEVGDLGAKRDTQLPSFRTW